MIKKITKIKKNHSSDSKKIDCHATLARTGTVKPTTSFPSGNTVRHRRNEYVMFLGSIAKN